MKFEYKGACYLARPRSVFANHPEHGVWDIEKDENGMITFDSADEARTYAVEKYGEDVLPKCYAIAIVG